ncbi:hypothetical protein C1646_748474 [Rhizophagus diaphanus]|nr:hypothetical protein C1646_748474 [Rhizophagus diaphanus] [Rhizophagus sp. MUCL 43196]
MSLEQNEEQTRFLIDERKTGNEVYHKTPKRSKTDFWEEISNKLNENNNINYFTGEACNKKFLSLTRAYYVRAQQHSNTVTPSSSPNIPRRSQSSRIPRPIHSPNTSCLDTSRPMIPTIPSFSQNANVINVTFNYGGAQTEEN